MRRILGAVLIFAMTGLTAVTPASAGTQSLGKITVVTAGTPVKISSTLLAVKSLMIQADPANVGTYTMLKDASGNIICKISKGQSCTPPTPPNTSGVDLSTLSIDADTNGDGAFVSYAY